MLEHCTDRGFHFVSGTGWVNFNDSKRAIEMTDYRFDEDSLTMDVTMQAGSSVDGSTLALPNIFHGAAISIATLDGATMEIKPQHLEGREQVLFSTDYSAGQSKRWRIKWG